MADRTEQRLRDDLIGWLTTVRRDGQPQSSPVWFVGVGGVLWVRSQVDAGKVANVRANAKVAFHLDDDGAGGDVHTFEATAEIVDDLPEEAIAAYLAKYGARIERMGTTPEEMMRQYAVTLRLQPGRVRSW
jgi:PPOX class probable F420-dependent enzyme